MRIFEVVPDGQGWKVVELEGPCISLSLHASKEVAISDGCRVATENEPSHLIIKSADGRIEQKFKYGYHPPDTPAEIDVRQS